MTLGDFSKQAEAYHKARPTYPADLIDQLISDAAVVPGDSVADFGAGTGIMTQILVDRGFVVSAIEPNESMRKQADVRAARWVSGTFEDSQLEPESQRWAIAAQAFHWADPPRCLPEIHRILQPDCLFTVLWNNRSKRENDVVTWTEDAIRRHVPEFDEAYRNRDWTEILVSTGHFTFAQHRIARHTISMSRERFLELWNSHNRLNTIAGPERFARFFGELTTHLQQCGVEQIDVQYDCEVWSVRRK